MKKRIGSCLAMVIFIAVICLWVGTKEMEKQDNIVEGGSMGTIEEGRDEKHRDAWEEKRASDLETIDASEDIYDAFPNAVYEHIRSLYHDDNFLDIPQNLPLLQRDYGRYISAHSGHL